MSDTRDTLDDLGWNTVCACEDARHLYRCVSPVGRPWPTYHVRMNDKAVRVCSRCYLDGHMPAAT